MTTLTNTPYDQLEVGMEAESRRLCVADDLFVFANASGNLNPAHMPKADHDGDGTIDQPVAPSMWLAAMLSAVLGNKLPGPGTLFRAISLDFLDRARAGEEIVSKVKLIEKMEDRVVRFAVTVSRADGALLANGTAEVIAPERPVSFDASDVPGLTVRRHVHFDRLLEKAAALPAIPTAVVAPEEPNSLGGAILAAKHTLITPILIGDRAKIEAAAAELGEDISGFELVDVAGHEAAAAAGVAMANAGKAQAVMKGHLHTDELLHHVFKREGGLRTKRRVSHVFVMDVPGMSHLLMVTDAAINIAPVLEEKVDIVQNAIDLAKALGVETPRVAVLSAVEMVNPKIPSTIEAAALAKMADRGQIKGGLVDGPLAMDNAIDMGAAKTKGITSTVAGQADILLAPNLEAGNMIAKQLTFLAHAEAAGLVIGTSCPVILTSRADDDKARLASCAVAALYAFRDQSA